MSDQRVQGNAWLVHGISVQDGGNGTVGRLGEALFLQSNFRPRMFRYGDFNLRDVLLHNPAVAQRLTDQVEEGDVGIGHSNGCTVLHRASELGAKFDCLVYINPALDRDLVPAPHIPRCYVLHSGGGDLATEAAALIPGVKWGDMGNDGYVPQTLAELDERMVNINLSEWLNDSWVTHSEAFADHHVHKVARLVAALVRKVPIAPGLRVPEVMAADIERSYRL